MIRKKIIGFCLLASSLLANAQVKSPVTTLHIISEPSAYKASCLAKPENKLIEIKNEIPEIRLDIRYATENNFMGQVMYSQARAFARRPVVNALKKVQNELKKKGYGLKIFDAYRPYSVTVAFYQKASDKAFVANPKKGSRHNRGCAVDLTIIDLHTGQEIKMPSPYDSFSPEASPSYQNLPEEVLANRSLLISTMKKFGFRVISNEWWHYDFNGWSRFDLLDIPFEDL